MHHKSSGQSIQSMTRREQNDEKESSAVEKNAAAGNEKMKAQDENPPLRKLYEPKPR